MLHLAEHDALTDLPNRLLLNDRLTRALAIARRYERRVAVLFLDCDRFKHINDTLGHAIGDQVLKSISRRRPIRGPRLRYRQPPRRRRVPHPAVGSRSRRKTPAPIAQKIIAAIAEPHLISGHELALTASIGIAMYPEDGQDAQSLISRADTAMYHAKSSGRNQVGFYRSDMEAPAVKRLSLESELRNAVDGDEFVLHYQPTI